ncbi:MAG TPA: hypothetical protein DCG90_06595 [Sphingobium sp.]|nr:zinc-binding dehydrogenase [Sphingobium sp.]HAF41416.1 hypothetical protein [Sphingobium sp.]
MEAFISEGRETRALDPLIAKIFTFDEIREATRFPESNQEVGKVVVTI